MPPSCTRSKQHVSFPHQYCIPIAVNDVHLSIMANLKVWPFRVHLPVERQQYRPRKRKSEIQRSGVNKTRPAKLRTEHQAMTPLCIPVQSIPHSANDARKNPSSCTFPLLLRSMPTTKASRDADTTIDRLSLQYFEQNLDSSTSR